MLLFFSVSQSTVEYLHNHTSIKQSIWILVLGPRTLWHAARSHDCSTDDPERTFLHWWQLHLSLRGHRSYNRSMKLKNHATRQQFMHTPVLNYYTSSDTKGQILHMPQSFHLKTARWPESKHFQALREVKCSSVSHTRCSGPSEKNNQTIFISFPIGKMSTFLRDGGLGWKLKQTY